MSESTNHLLVCSAKHGVSKAQVLEAIRRTNAALRRLPGYVEHEIACAAEGGWWVDILHWADRDAALKAESLFRRHPGTRAIAEVIEQRWIMVLPEPAAGCFDACVA